MRLAALRVASRPAAGEGPALAFGLPAALLGLAAAGWWWSARMAGDMSGGGMEGMGDPMSLGAFVVAWAAMMAAMMLPGALPAVRLYARAAARGRAAPVPCFVAGYLAAWTLAALPGYLAWRELQGPVARGEAWAGRLAGATLLAAALWQLTPLKSLCLRHCRSPLGFFLRFGGRVQRPAGALHMGIRHAGFCFGCCWALFAALVALGTMSLLWMALFTALIVLEKLAPQGRRIAVAGALALAAAGAVLLTNPSTLVHLT
jgi:predicted metal-binding membrane protein